MAAFPFDRPTAAVLAAMGACGYLTSATADELQTNLETDGRTDTTVEIDGDRRSVTTGTTRGDSAFNSFKHFRVARGDTVDLHLPESTSNLINLVHDSKAVIDGTVNSLIADAIGGHVVFADPHGIVVGASGTLNVGSLLLTTPTQSFMDDIIDPDSHAIDDDAVQRLMDGDAPQNRFAEILVEGRVNSSADIRMEGVNIEVSGELHAATAEAQRELFEASVNTSGLQEADFASADGGDIVIGARDDQGEDTSVTIAGDVRAAGDVEVTARTSHQLFVGIAGGSSDVTVSGRIVGEDVRLAAETDVSVDLETQAGEIADDVIDDGFEAVEAFMDDLSNQRPEDVLLGGAMELFGSAAVTQGDARVDVADGADITAAGDVDIDATATRTINRPRSGSAVEQLGLGIAAAVQLGETSATVRDGASIDAGGDLAVRAESENTLLNAAEPKPAKSAQNAAVAGIAVSYADITTDAVIEEGASVSARDVAVEAENRNAHTTTSKVEVDGKEGVAGVSFALSLVNTEANATLGADLDDVRDVRVDANTESTANVTTANGKIKSGQKGTWDKIKKKVGDEAKNKVKDQATSLGTKLASKIPGLGDKLTTSKKDGDAEKNKKDTESIASKIADKFRLSGALAIADSSQTSDASIAEGAEIRADGDVTVLARVSDSGIRNSAQSAVAAATKKGNADFTTSAAVNWADHHHGATATVGDGAVIRAERLGVGSEVDIPLNLSDELQNVLDAEDVFTSMDTFWDITDVFSWFKDLYDARDLAGHLFNSTANSTGTAEDVGLAGSVNVFNADQASTAWVGDGADVRVTAADEGWTTDLGDDNTWEWSGPLAVDARKRITSINVAGNFGWLKFFGTGDTKKEDGTALGGAFNWTQYTGDTVAGIGDGAVIDAEGVSVEADAFHQIVSLAPSAGKSDQAALNGTFTISRMDTGTRASVAASADVTADRLTIDADESLSVWTAAGAVALSENIGVGASVAVNDIATQSLAFIGDNRLDSPFLTDPDGLSDNGAPAGGTLRVNELTVDALTVGQAGTFAVAGAAVVDSDDDDEADDSSLMKRGKDAIKSRVGKVRNKAGDLAENIPLLSAATSEIRGKQDANKETPKEGNEIDGGSSPGSKDTSSTAGNQSKGASPDIAASGSVGVNLTRQETRASVEDVTIEARDEEAAVATDIQSVNDTLMLGTAGAGSLIKAGGDDSSFQTALAGALSLNVLQNDTVASMDGVTLNDAGDTRVEAMSAGDQVSIGLGLAMNVSGEDTSDASLSAAGSASVNWTANTTDATVRDSVVTRADGVDDNDAPMSVLAYDRTRIATGGGSLVAGGTAGVGAAFTLSNIGNTTDATVAGSELDMGALGVRALTRNRILSGGAVGAFSDQDDSVTLAGTLVFNLVNNTVDASIESSDNGHSTVTTSGEVRVTAADLDEDVEEGLEHLNSINGSPDEDAVDFALNDLDVAIPDGSDADPDDDNFDPDHDYELPQNAADVASSGSIIVGVAGTLQAGRADNVGASIAVNTISNEHTARIEQAEVNAGGDVSVDARDTGAILGASIGAAVTSGDFAGMGSVSGNIIAGSTEAVLDGSDVDAHDLRVNGVSSANILSFAGNISGSAKAAGGAAVAINHTGGLGDDDQVTSALASQTVARVQDSDVTLSGDAAVRGARQSRILSASISGEGAGKVSLGGSLNLNTHVDRTRAELLGTTLNARNLVVETGDDRLNAAEIFAGSGQFGGAGKAAIGGSFTISTIESQRDALVRDSAITVDDDARVGSVYDADIINMAVGGGGAGTVAVGGSLVTATIAGHSRSVIEGGSITAGGLDVSAAGDSLRIISAAGNAQGAGTAAVGGASTVNTFATDRVARLDGVNATVTGDIDVLAGARTEINTGAGAGGGAGTAAVLGSATINTVVGSETAEIIGDSDITSTEGDLSVRADEGERIIRSISGNVGGAGTAAVGGANVTNTISGVREALIMGGSLNIAETINLASGGTAIIESIAASAAGAGTAAVTGSLAASTIDGTEDVILQDATVDAGAVNLSNIGDMTIRTASGNASFAGTAAVGGASSVNVMLNRRQALVTGSNLTLGGDLDVLTANNGSIETLAASGGAAGTAAVGGALTVNVLESELSAGLRASDVNAGLSDWDTTRNITVQAQENGSIDSIAGQAQVAESAAVGGTGAVNYLGNSVDAFVEGGGDATYRGTNLLVDAQSNAAIQTVAVGASGANRVALAGSAAVNVMQTETTARIGRNSEGGDASDDPDVEARNNVGVTAASNDIVRVAAGAASFATQGGAGSAGAIVNVVNSRTHAGIDGSGTRVNALALDPDDVLEVSAGNLQGDPQIGPGDDEDLADNPDGFFTGDEDTKSEFAGLDELVFNPAEDLAEETQEVTGLAVRASSTQQVGTVSSALAAAIPDISTFGIAGFAGSVLAGTNVVDGHTSAVVDGATINDSSAGNRAAQDVSIGASSHSLTVDYALAGSASTFAGAGVLGASVISRDTEAGLYNADVGNANDLDVFANATQQGTSVSLAAGFGAFGAGGTFAGVTLLGDTSAGISDTTADVNAVNVDARNDRAVNLHSGAISIGAVAVSGSLTFSLVDGSVDAFIEGDGNGSTGIDTNGGDVRVNAETDTTLFNNVLGAGAGAGAIAGSAALNIVTNDTSARVQGAELGGGSAIGALDIGATETVAASTIAGSASAGMIAGAGAANVLVMQGDLTAELADSDVTANGDVDVDARRGVRARQMAAAGAMGDTALTGGLALAVLGSGNTVYVDEDGNEYDPGDDLDHGDDGTLSLFDDILSADTLASDSDNEHGHDADHRFQFDLTDAETGDTERVDLFGDVAGEGDILGESEQDALRSQTNQSASDYLNNDGGHQTTARIRGSRVDAGGDVTVSADERLHMEQFTGAIGLGNTAAVGGAAGMAFSWANVGASIDGHSTVDAGGAVDVDAGTGAFDNEDDSIEQQVLTGQGAVGLGLGAAVAVADMNNQVVAQLNGDVTAAGAIDVTASDLASLDVQADGYTIGGAGAAGIVIGYGGRNTDVIASVGNGVTLDAGAVNIDAFSGGGVSVEGTAAAGGILGSGAGVGIGAQDQSSVSARVGAGADLTADGDVTVDAVSDTAVFAEALGVAVSGGVGIGASVATALLEADVTSEIGDGASIATDEGLGVSARLGAARDDRSDAPNVRAKSTAAGGGVIAGANATVANVSTDADVTARIGDDVTLPDGDVSVQAVRSSAQEVLATGVSAGIVAAGANLAFAESSGATVAELGRDARTDDERVGDISVRADGQDVNITDVLAGSGGVAAAQAATSEITTGTTTRATIGGNGADQQRVLSAGDVQVLAQHEDRFAASVDAFQAAVAGMSGASAHTRLGSSVEAGLADGVQIYASDVGLDAHNAIEQIGDGNSVQAGSGGVAAGSAVFHELSIAGSNGSGRSESRVRVGDDVAVLAEFNGDDGRGQIELNARNTVNIRDDVLLDTGGGISGAMADTELEGAMAADVTIGDDTAWHADDRIEAAAWGRYVTRMRSQAKTYGGVSVVGGVADVDLSVDESITLGSDTTMSSFGVINLTTGESPQGRQDSRFELNSRTNVYNYNAVPLDTSANASATLNHTGDVSVGAGSDLLSARDVRFAAYDGVRRVTASGRAHNPYLDALSVVSGNSSTDVNGSTGVTLSGDVEAGYLAERIIEITEDGDVIASDDGLLFGEERLTPSEDLFEPGEDAYELASDEETDAIWIMPIFAAAGSVFVHGDTIDVDGSAELTARGGAEVRVSNASEKSIVIEGIEIADRTGGEVRATGRGSLDGLNGLSANSLDAGAEPQVTLENTFDNAAPGSSDAAPDIIVTGDISNPLGRFRIDNASGDYIQGANVLAREISADIPQGSYIVSQLDDSWQSQGSPTAIWRGQENLPTNAESAVHLLANTQYDISPDNAELRSRTGTYGAGRSIHFFNLSNDYNPNEYSEGEARDNHFSDGHFQLLHDGGRYLHVQRVNLRATSRSQDGDVADADADPLTQGGSIFVEADTIDVNGRIISGQQQDQLGIHLTEENVETLRRLGPGEFGRFVAGQVVEVGGEDELWNVESPDGRTPILAEYDPNRDEINLYNVSRPSGANVVLRGRIMSTSTHGSIEVNNGYLDVDIRNDSDANLVLNNIDTGDGQVANIRIEDKQQDLTTWYRYELGGNVEMRSTDGISTDWDSADVVAIGARDDDWGYQPEEGLRYEWTRRARLERERTTGSGWWENGVTNWNFVDSNGDTVQDNPWELTSEGLTTGNSSSEPRFTQEISGSGMRHQNVNVSHGRDYGQGTDSDDDPLNWQYRIVLGGTITSTSSVSADNPIDVLFSGNEAGRINVESGGNVRFAGNLRNISGETNVDAGGAISQADQASIRTRDLSLIADGDIGSEARGINATLEGGGTVNMASENGHIRASLQGADVQLEGLHAGDGRDVELSAAGAIVAADGVGDDTVVSGRSVWLESTSGSVGAADQPLAVQLEGATPTALPDERGQLDVTAGGDVHVLSDGGNLFIGQIEASGDVTLEADGIYNASTDEQTASVDSDELAELWESIGLIGDGAEDSADRTVRAYENKVQRWYNDYFQLAQLAGGSDDLDNLELDDAARDLLRQRASEFWLTQKDAVANERVAYSDAQKAVIEQRAAEAAGGGITDGGVDAYAAFRMADIQERMGDVDGVDADSLLNDDFQSGWAYSATDAERDHLTEGADGWSEQRLRNAINASALESAPEVTLRDDPNIAGRSVELIAHEQIGQDVESRRIDLGSDFTDAERALLITAGPGDVTEIRGADGTIEALDVRRRDLVQVDALEVFDAVSTGNVYVGGDGELRVGRVRSYSDDIRLLTTGGLFGDGGSDGLYAGGDVFLTAGSGSIAGDTGGALSVDVREGAVRLASAGGDVALLDSSGQGLTIGQISAGDQTSLATGGDLTAVDNASDGSDEFDISTGSLDLDVSGDVDGGGRALRVQMSDSGTLTGDIGGDAGINATSGGIRFGELAVGGDLSADATSGRVRFTDAVSANGGADITANDALTFTDTGALSAASGDINLLGATLTMDSGASIDAGGAVSLVTPGDMVLSHVNGSGGDVTAPGVTANAGGSIRAADDTGRVGSDDATVALQAGDGIGTVDQAVRVDAERTEAVSDNGAIQLQLLRPGQGGEVEATNGAVHLTDAGAGMQLDAITAADAIQVNAGDDARLGVVTSSDAGAQADVNGRLGLTRLATAGNATLDAQSLHLDDGAVGGDFLATTSGDQHYGTVDTGGRADITTTGAGDVTYAELTGDDRLDMDVAGTITAEIIDPDADVTRGALAFDDTVRIETGADADLGSVASAGSDVIVTVHGRAGVELLDAADDAVLNGQTLRVDGGVVGGDLLATTTGDQHYGTVDTGGQATIATTDNGDVTYTELTGDDRLDMDVAGTVTASTVDPDADVTRGALAFRDAVSISAGGDTVMGAITSTSADVHVTADGHAAMERVRAEQGALDVLGNGAFVGDAAVRDRLRIDTTADPADTEPRDMDTWADQNGATIGFGELASETDSVHVFSGWNVRGGSAEAEVDVILLGQDVVFDALETRTRDVELQAVEDVTGQRVVSERDITVAAGGTLSLDSTDYGGELSLEAGRNIFVRVGGDLDLERIVAGNNAELFAGGFIDLISVDAGGIVTLEADEFVNIDEYIDAGGDVRARAGTTQSIGGDVTAGGSVDAVSGGTMTYGGNIAAGEGVTLDAGGALAGNDLTAGRDSHLQAGDTLDMRAINVAGDVGLDALDDIHVVTVVSDGDQAIDSRGALGFDALVAGGAIDARAADDVTGERASASDALTMIAGAPNPSGDLADRDVRIDHVQAHAVDLRAGNDLLANDGGAIAMETTAAARFTGRDILADITQSGADLMAFEVIGANGALARDVALTIDGDAGLIGDQFRAERAEVRTTSRHLQFDQGRIGEMFVLETADVDLMMNNTSPAIQPVDVQLYEPDNDFSLIASGPWAFSDAYVGYFRPGFAVTSPNLTDNRVVGRDVDGRSIESDSNRGIGRTLGSAVTEAAIRTGMEPTVAVLDAIQAEEQGVAALNLGTEDAVSEEGGSSDDDDDTADILPPGLDLTGVDQARSGN
ncbi:haemagglutination activity domain-containing protein [Aquisalimonas asiatica]|uniref:Haemagglutination activity domain-containing protein n=2 Tax=Aquisalimonas asiatica TaxID=406100 RepID=A0A1H8SPL0_9GAMM|nr:haemagglutination activity domain-containing protein [Aquisalimonas asiatica]